MSKFNDNLKELLDQIKNLYPNQANAIDDYYIFDKDNNTHIYVDEFYKNCNKLGYDIGSKNEIIFSEDITIINKVNFYEIWNSPILTDEYKENIWKHIHTMYILAYEYIKNVEIKKELKRIRVLRINNNLDKESEILLNIVECLTGKYTNIVNKESESEDNENKESDKKNTFKAPDMFNGMIGNLAKEIASEIDTTDINFDNPDTILKDLFNGNMGEENSSGLGKLVKNISDKIQTKLTSGELDEKELLGEAKNIVNNIGSMGGEKGSPIGDIFSKMMNNEDSPMDNIFGSMMDHMKDVTNNEDSPMGNMFESVMNSMKDNMNNMDSSMNDIKNNQQFDMKDVLNKMNDPKFMSNMNNIMKNNVPDHHDQKQRLRKKLNEKKKLLKEKELLLQEEQKLLENKCINTEEDNENLDMLALEIEAIGKTEEKKQKKQKKKKKK